VLKTEDPLWSFFEDAKVMHCFCKWQCCCNGSCHSLYFTLDFLFSHTLSSVTIHESFIHSFIHFPCGAIISFLVLCPSCAAECLKCNDLSISSPNYSNPPPTKKIGTLSSPLCHFLQFFPDIQVYSRPILIAKYIYISYTIKMPCTHHHLCHYLILSTLCILHILSHIFFF